MADKSWKAFERYICKRFGGQRRGADFRDADGGKNDCTDVSGFSIECKWLKRPTYGQMRLAIMQAKNSASSDDISIAIVGKTKQPRSDALVVMDLDDFIDWFVN